MNAAESIVRDDTRSVLILRAYLNLLAAVVDFVLIEGAYFYFGVAEMVANALLSVSWLVVLGGFILIGVLAAHTAHGAHSRLTQCVALAAYVVAESVIFAPLLYYAEVRAPGTVALAAKVTLIGFAVLTLIAFKSRRDFSFALSFLVWGGGVALALIVVSVLSQLHVGWWFSIGMVAYAGVAILYDTSNIIHHYRPDQDVAAALELFASIALFFWSVVRYLPSADAADTFDSLDLD